MNTKLRKIIILVTIIITVQIAFFMNLSNFITLVQSPLKDFTFITKQVFDYAILAFVLFKLVEGIITAQKNRLSEIYWF